MKTKILIFAFLTSMLAFASCKKERVNPQIAFANSMAEGVADANGEFVLAGHISSAVRLEKVVLTKQGETTPFLVDESTAKNKNEYDFYYQVTGITANTYIIMDVYDQGGGRVTQQFLIKK